MNTLGKKFMLATLVAAGSMAAISTTVAAAGFQDNIQKDIVNLDNGVQITLTTEDTAALDKLIERAGRLDEKAPINADITHSVDVLDNGVKITIVSDNPDEVTKIQQKAEIGPKEKGPKDGEKPECVVENLDNGVKITISSDDANTISKIQERSQNMQVPEASTAVRDVVLTDTGVIETITSDNADEVAKIQAHHEDGKLGKGEHKGPFGHGGQGGQRGEKYQGGDRPIEQ